MIYVLGARGRLGRAIVAAWEQDEVVALDRAVYDTWSRPGASAEVARFFGSAVPGSTVIVAAGLLDPALPAEQHRRVNFDLPGQVIEGACAAGVRVVTVGTIMERLIEHPNPYVASKAELGRLVAQRALAGDPVTHLQVHTLYGGGEPAPFMFLGQLCDSLRQGRPFEMSPGRQLREYHHVDDEALALRAILQSGCTGVVALSHGAPCSLCELATHVFAALGRPELLRLGARPEPAQDNYATVLPRPAVLESVAFRPALQGVTAYVEQILSKRAQEE